MISKHLDAALGSISLAGYYITQEQLESKNTDRTFCPSTADEHRTFMWWLGAKDTQAASQLSRCAIALVRQLLFHETPIALEREYEEVNDEALPAPFTEQALRERLVQAYHDRRATSRAERGREMELEPRGSAITDDTQQRD